MSAAGPSKSQKASLNHVRDTVESVYVAIVLAFVLRAFMIEAFVIPTGSMANSLYGEHYQLQCPCCGYEYAYGLQRGEHMLRGEGVIPRQAQCPNCGYPYAAREPGRRVLKRAGDRVLVLKYLYEFAEPRPWDVVVFKNPQNNRENYIKRLIGLPGESIEIVGGDIFVSKDDRKNWRIRRKPPEAQEAIWQVVYDNDFPPDEQMLESVGFSPPRWRQQGGSKAWNLSSCGRRVFGFLGGGRAGRLDFQGGSTGFRPTNGYNAQRINGGEDATLCTDWKLSCVLMPAGDAHGRLNLVFESFSNRFRAEINLDGRVRLLHQRRDRNPDRPGEWTVWGQTRMEPFTPGRGRRIALSSVDYRASVWVDRRAVLQSTDLQYPGDYALARRRSTLRQRIREGLEADQAKLSRQWRWARDPQVWMSAEGGRFRLRHVRLMRDVYYTSPRLKIDGHAQGAEHEYVQKLMEKGGGASSWKRDANGNCLAWGTTGNPIRLRKHPEDRDLDEFFCLGDNSSQSLDGRGWFAAAPSLRLYDEDGNFQYQLGTVPRYNMLGRAMLVYWPAGFRLPILHWPIVPNVGRMRLIR